MTNSTSKTTKDKDTYFVISYRDPKDGKVLTLKANKIVDSSLGLSFVCLSDFIFEINTTVVNPIEEQMKKRFEKVKNLHISIYSILSIEEIGSEHLGLSFQNDKSNLLVLPGNQGSDHSKN